MQYRPGDAPNLRRTSAPNLSADAYKRLMQATHPNRLDKSHDKFDIGYENAKAELRDLVEALNNGQYS